MINLRQAAVRVALIGVMMRVFLFSQRVACIASPAVSCLCDRLGRAAVGLACSARAALPCSVVGLRPLASLHMGLAPPTPMISPDAPRAGGDVGHT
jgi:hypothetical protein